MSTLQELLNLGLVSIGPNDTVFKKIKSASSVFVEKLRENPDLLIPSTTDPDFKPSVTERDHVSRGATPPSDYFL